MSIWEKSRQKKKLKPIFNKAFNQHQIYDIGKENINIGKSYAKILTQTQALNQILYGSPGTGKL